MGLVKPTNAVGIVEGKIGDLVFARYEDGRIVVKQRPVRTAPFTLAEIQNQCRFAKAVVFLRTLPARPELHAIYKRAARIRRKRACDVAMADFLNPPAIRHVDLRGYTGKQDENIRIEAVDDLEVVSVALIVTALDGTLIESGPAVRDEESGLWLYAAKTRVQPGQTVVVHVTAADNAGNAVTETVDHAIRAATISLI